MGCRALALCAVLLAACGGAGEAPAGGEDPNPPPQEPSAFGLTERTAVTGLTFPLAPPQPGEVAIVNAFPNLSFTKPLFLTFAPGDSKRLFVVENRGTIQVFQNDSTTTTKKTFLDIQGKVQSGGECGLLGLAFDPDFQTNGYFYVDYTADLAGERVDSTVSRFKVSSDPDVADDTSETILFTVTQPYDNHNGGWIGFGPDGYLYITTGDGGAGGDPDDRAQDLTTVLGKVLRITKTGGIPSDNPFVGQGGGVRGEIWAYGLRNPWRAGFDRDTGQLWCGDVGQSSREEIDLIVKGGDYGWDTFEGTLDFENPGGVDINTTQVPIRDYEGGVMIGGYVYRGNDVPSLRGAYIHGDYGSGKVWALFYDGNTVTSDTVLDTVTNPTSFGEDYDGELYICSYDGHIYRMTENGGGSAQPFPDTLSKTGLFSDVVSLTPAPGLIEYAVNAPLWSDGARKRRWIALPGTSQIGFAADGSWVFPQGTVLVKHFDLDVLGGTVRLETRVLVNEQMGWHGYTYRWNAAQTDANLLSGSETAVFNVPDPLLGSRVQTWTFPSRTDCLGCHTNAAGRVLGVRTHQLNRDFDYPAATDNQLRAWNNIGLFTTDIGDHAQYGAMPDPADTSAPLAERARAYLDVNCAICHRPDGPPQTAFDLRFTTPLASMNAVDVVPGHGNLGITDARIIASGSKERSVLWERIRRTDDNRMPPLGSSVVHDAAVDLIGQWIDMGPQ